MKFRKIKIRNMDWEWKVGKDSAVIKFPDGKNTIVPLEKIHPSKSVYVIERGRYKKTSDGMITPRMISQFIEKELLEK